MNCIFCGCFRTDFLVLKRGIFLFCSGCGGVFLLPENRLDSESQRLRYLQHHNNLNDPGYKRFLDNFISAILPVFPELPSTVVDYGCGPVPALVELLKEKFSNSRDFSVRGWDPFFAADTALFSGGADLVTCLEVAEHFESPRDDFKSLAAVCRPGGVVAVGTLPVPCGGKEKFAQWWYKEDCTHVSFYTRESLKIVGQCAGLHLIKEVNGRVFLFKKEGSCQKDSVFGQLPSITDCL